MTRVLVVASSPIVRGGLEALLREDARFTVVPTDGAGPLALRLRDRPPDVLLMEIAGSDVVAKLRALALVDVPPIVLLVDRPSRAELRYALQSGVRAVLPRDASGAELSAAIEGAATGLVVLSGEDMDALLPSAAGETADSGALAGEALSTRETEVLAMMAEGLANKEIGARLAISEHTVKFHVSSVLAKLGASSRGEAVARGVRGGLIVI